MNDNIPAHILQAAAEHCYNSVSCAGVIDGATYYSVGRVDEHGLPLPEGLPCYLKDDNGEVVHICDSDFAISVKLYP